MSMFKTISAICNPSPELAFANALLAGVARSVQPAPLNQALADIEARGLGIKPLKPDFSKMDLRHLTVDDRDYGDEHPSLVRNRDWIF